MSDQPSPPPSRAPAGIAVGQVLRITVSKDFDDGPSTEYAHLVGITDTHGSFRVLRRGFQETVLQTRILPWNKIDLVTCEGTGDRGLLVRVFVRRTYRAGRLLRSLYDLAPARDPDNRVLLYSCLSDFRDFEPAYDLLFENAADLFERRGDAAFEWADAFNWRDSAQGDPATELQLALFKRYGCSHPAEFAERALAHLDEKRAEGAGEYRKSVMALVCAWQSLAHVPESPSSGDLLLRLLEHALRLDAEAFKRLPLFWALQTPFPGASPAYETRVHHAILQALSGWKWGDRQEERRRAMDILCGYLRLHPWAFKDIRFWSAWKDFSADERGAFKDILTELLAGDSAFCEAMGKISGVLPDEIVALPGFMPETAARGD